MQNSSINEKMVKALFSSLTVLRPLPCKKWFDILKREQRYHYMTSKSLYGIIFISYMQVKHIITLLKDLSSKFNFYLYDHTFKISHREILWVRHSEWKKTVINKNHISKTGDNLKETCSMKMSHGHYGEFTLTSLRRQFY